MPADEAGQAEVVVHQHLRGPGERGRPAVRHARPPQAAEGREPPDAHRGGRMPGPEGPGRDPAAGSVGGRGGRHACPALAAGADPVGRSGTARRWTSASSPRFSRARCRRAGVPPPRVGLGQRGVRQPRARSASCRWCAGPQLSRSLGDILAEVHGLARRGVVEVTLLGQNVNTYGRDLTVPGSSRQARFAELLARGRRRRRDPSGPVHQPAPHDFTEDVVEAMAECRRRVRAHPLPAAVRVGSGARADAALVPRPSGTWGGWTASAPPSRPSPSPPTSSSGSRGRPRPTSRRPFGWSMRPGSTLRSRSSTPASRHPAAGPIADQIPKEVVQERFERLVALQDRMSLERNRGARSGTDVELLVEGRGGRATGRADPDEQARPRPRVCSTPASSSRLGSPRPQPHHLMGTTVAA